MSIRPNGADDAITAVLRSISFRSSLFSRAHLRSPFSVETRGAPSGIFHAVHRGGAILRVGDQEHSLATGDVVLLPRGAPHVLCDDRGLAPVHLLKLPTRQEGVVDIVEGGGEGAETELLCGTYDLGESAAHPLFAQLDEQAWILRADDDELVPTTVRLLAREVSGEAVVGAALAERLAEVLILVAVRTLAHRTSKSGWLKGTADPQLARALGLIHERAAEAWSSTKLAQAVGMSRSSFYERFTQIIGEPPGSYLARWRMHLATGLLQDGARVGEVAFRVGYGSEAAFSKAFKRVVGVAPSELR